MKKNRWIAIATVATLGAGLAACSSSSSPESSEAGTESDSVTVWVMGDSSANFDELVAPFEEESGISVETVAVPWDAIDQKFTAPSPRVTGRTSCRSASRSCAPSPTAVHC